MNGSRFLGFAIILAAALICVGLIAGGFLIRSAQLPANTVKVDMPQGLVDGGGGRFITEWGPNRLLYLDKDGRIYIIGCRAGEQHPFIVDVYTVTHAPRRHAGNPERRSPHGYYLDPATGERKAEIDHARRKFLDIASGRSVQIALDAAEDLAGMGEHEFLLQQLDTKAFAGRRAAALVLGKSGYVQAVPILIDMLGDGELGIRSSAADYLKKITGKDLVEEIEIEVQHKAVKKYKEWWENYQAEQKKKEK